MKILVACEYSGLVSAAFRKRGHDVTSCDLLPSELPGKHYTGDVLEILYLVDWDLVIGFPPCTFLSKAQIWMYDRVPGRTAARDAALDFFVTLYKSCKRVALENPPGYISRAFRPPDQIVQPHWFGNSHRKEICLWLRNVPPLIATLYSPGRTPVFNHSNGRMPREQRQKIHSRFFPEVADAMAHQWSNL